MSNRIRRTSGITAAILLLAAGATAGAGELLLKDATILDPEAKRAFRGSMLVRGGRIARVAPSPPADFSGEVLELDGRFVIPGLNDLHVHSYGNAGPDGMPEILGTAGVARRMLAAGVTGFLDLSGFEDQILGLRDAQRQGGLAGADIYSAGTAFTCPGGHGTQFPNPAREVTAPDEARRSVAELARKQPDVIKIIYIPSHPTLPSIDRKTMAAIVDAAADAAIPTVAHVNYWSDAADLVEAGVDAFTHVSHERPPEELLALMRRRGTFAIPTLAVHTELAALAADPSLLEAPLLTTTVHPDLLAAYRDPAGYEPRLGEWMSLQRQRRQGTLSAVGAFAAAGVEVLAGTDAGNPGVFQGYSLHRELGLLVEAGLTPWQALAAATTLPGKLLGRRFGVQPGDLANLVILAASPLDDITNTQRIVGVVHHGRVVRRDARVDLEP